MRTAEVRERMPPFWRSVLSVMAWAAQRSGLAEGQAQKQDGSERRSA